MSVLDRWKQRVSHLRSETYALFLAYRDPRVPVYAKIFAALVVAYAFSPLDLIPDFIPVLGYLDDLVLVPLGIALALKMIPAEVLADCREQARDAVDQNKPAGRLAAIVIVGIWLLLAALALVLVWRILGR